MARKTRNSSRVKKPEEDVAEVEPPIKKRLVLVSDTGKRVRKRALELLRGGSLDENTTNGTTNEAVATEGEEEPVSAATTIGGGDTVEFPILYAALRRIQQINNGADPRDPEAIQNKDEIDEAARDVETQEMETDLVEQDYQLIRDAALAVPYLIFKRLCEQFMLPRTMGGLALSDAKAKQVAKELLSLGSCCQGCDTLTEPELVQKCPSFKNMDTRKLLAALQQVGQEARSQMDQVDELLMQGIVDTEKEIEEPEQVKSDAVAVDTLVQEENKDDDDDKSPVVAKQDQGDETETEDENDRLDRLDKEKHALQDEIRQLGVEAQTREDVGPEFVNPTDV